MSEELMDFIHVEPPRWTWAQQFPFSVLYGFQQEGLEILAKEGVKNSESIPLILNINNKNVKKKMGSGVFFTYDLQADLVGVRRSDLPGVNLTSVQTLWFLGHAEDLSFMLFTNVFILSPAGTWERASFNRNRTLPAMLTESLSLSQLPLLDGIYQKEAPAQYQNLTGTVGAVFDSSVR